MELVEYGNRPAQSAGVLKEGTESITVAAGQNFRIETSPNGEEILDLTCPTGKEYIVQLVVSLVEVDV